MSSTNIIRKRKSLLPSKKGVVSLEQLFEDLNVHIDNQSYFRKIPNSITTFGADHKGKNGNFAFHQSVLDDLISIAENKPSDVSTYQESFSNYVDCLRGKPIKTCEDFFTEKNLSLYLCSDQETAKEFFASGIHTKAEYQKAQILKAFQKQGIYAYNRYLEEKDKLIEVKIEDIFLYELHLDSRENSSIPEILETHKNHQYDYAYIAQHILPNKLRPPDESLFKILNIVDFDKIILDKKRYKVRDNDPTLMISLDDPTPLTLKDILPLTHFSKTIYNKVIKSTDDEYFNVYGQKKNINQYFSEELRHQWQINLIMDLLDLKTENTKKTDPKIITKCEQMKTCLKSRLLELQLSENFLTDKKTKIKI